MQCSNFIFDTLIFPFSASQALTLLPLTLYMLTPPSLLSATDLGTNQFISHLAQDLFQSSTLTAKEMPVAPNCDTFRLLYRYCKSCLFSPLFRSKNILALLFLLFTLQCNVLGHRMGWLENTGESLLVTMKTWIYTYTCGLSPASNSIWQNQIRNRGGREIGRKLGHREDSEPLVYFYFMICNPMKKTFIGVCASSSVRTPATPLQMENSPRPFIRFE